MVTKSRSSVQTEVDASFLYKVLAEHEKDEQISLIFKEMSEVENKHAVSMYAKSFPGHTVNLPGPSRRARFINWIGKVFGYNYVLNLLLDTEKSISNAALTRKQKMGCIPDGSETNHVKILQALLNKNEAYGKSIARFESRHRSVGGNALRAAVLGGNDGLVSNFSLIMGVAGASANQYIVLTGIAGLLAGALSMALGEWISVKSSQELYENQMQIEMEEVEANPEDEQNELALIYMAKGVSRAEAVEMASRAFADKKQAHRILVREELGISPEELHGSAIEAAIFSFLLFAIGAIIPVIPFFFSSGTTAILISAGVSILGLFLIGSVITLFTNKSIYFSGFRQVIFGLMAATITFGIGKLIGVSLGS